MTPNSAQSLARARTIATTRRGHMKTELHGNARRERYVGRDRLGGPSSVEAAASKLDGAIREAVGARDQLLAVLARCAAGDRSNATVEARAEATARVQLAARLLGCAAVDERQDERRGVLEVRPGNLAEVATTVLAGELVYLRLERGDYEHLRRDLAARLTARGLVLGTGEGPGWFRVTGPQATAPDAACAVPQCGGTIRWGACRRCGTRQ